MFLFILIRPVWKHGPRSLVLVQVFEKLKFLYTGNSDRVHRVIMIVSRAVFFTQQEHVYWDPKDGELYLCRVKSGEILLEARSDTDVQIVRWIQVQGRKTNRTIQQLVPSEVSLRIARVRCKLHEVKQMIRAHGIETISVYS